MTSRLERLFILLESGQSSFLRRSAAHQIGEIVKTHPNELEQLLLKIKPLILNQSWDTRIAASQTIESIIKNLDFLELALFSDADFVINSDHSKLQNFRLELILKNGSKLLSSDTHKYEIKESDLNNQSYNNNQKVSSSPNPDLKEKIKQQRKLLVSKLGIDVGGAANLDTTHLFTDEDLIMSNSGSPQAKVSNPLYKRKLDNSMVDIKDEPEVKEEFTNGDAQDSSNKKIKIKKEESIDGMDVQDTDPVNGNIKPLELFIKWLIDKLVSPEWEIRHGASTTLREILKQISANKLKQGQFHELTIFFEYCLNKLLTVIALDRFADYIGDEAVAPVRETCAQIIGILSSHLNQVNKLEELCCILNNFIQQEDDVNWEIRHSGIMALKYTIAASAALVTDGQRDNYFQNLKLIFDLTFGNILKCLKDNDDDVRHVASTTLEPVSVYLTRLLDSEKIKLLIQILIDVLTNKLDDLATSCSNIMSLLSDLLSVKNNALIFLNLLNGESIIPNLIVFFQHSSINVKKTALVTINKIIIAINTNYEIGPDGYRFQFETFEKKENLTMLFRLLYQQAILLSSEHSFNLLQTLIEDLWGTLCEKLSVPYLINICFPFITTWILLMMHSPNQPIDSIYLIQQASQGEQSKEFIGSSQIKFEDKTTKDLIIIKCRLLSARMLAKLFYRIASTDITDVDSSEKPINVIVNFLCAQVNFKSGIQRFCFALLMIEWGKLIQSTHKNQENGNESHQNQISDQLKEKILMSLDENTIYFDEIAILFTRLQKDCRTLINILSKFDSKNMISYSGLAVFTFEDVANVCGLAKLLLNDPNQNIQKKLKIELQTLVANLADLNQQTSNEQENLQIRSSSSLAAASIAVNCLTQRMNPLIRPLMDSIRFEPNKDLQTIASKHLAILLSHCCKRSPNPIPKIFKNILNYLSNDPKKTPILQQMTGLKNFSDIPDKDYYDANRYYGILSGNTSLQQIQPVTTDITDPEIVQKQQANIFKLQTEKRGAELVLKSICEVYQNDVEQIIPELIQAPVSQIVQITELSKHNNQLTTISNKDFSQNVVKLIEACERDLTKYQEFIQHLQLIEFLCLCGELNHDLLKSQFLVQITNLNSLIKSPLTGVRNLVSRSISAICSQEIVLAMDLILEYLVDLLENSEFDLFARQGALELIFCLCDRLKELIIPFTVIFIVPILKRMCDLDVYVRTLASQCFALLVKLYPLGGGDNQGMIKNPKILEIKYQQQDFLDQLMDNRKLKPYELPDDVLIGVNLRPYQQMGVNWLNFLKKFNLHGILCDDMGLGKTLQSICILAGDHWEKQKKHKDNNLDDSYLPSIIICPTTLTNHWFHEIERFVDKKCLNPLIYWGSVNDREHVRRKFFNQSSTKNSHHINVLISSYDIIRHDIHYFNNQQWNYCILDEGHLIKSSKTKLFKSIKQIKASNRLILTGTPIQNNVTELWCLFDFLIPGYLGNEKQFYTKYAKIISPHSAMREKGTSEENGNSKKNSNSKSEIESSGYMTKNNGDKGFFEQGIIALEALHKQVLPFLLRRTKEEVLNDLPPKIIQDYYCEMSYIQTELYQDFAQSENNKGLSEILDMDEKNTDQKEDTKEDDENKKPQNTQHVFQALHYLKKVVNHPLLVLKKDHPKYSQIQSHLSATRSSLNDYKHSGKLVALRELLLECGIGNSSNSLDDGEASVSDSEGTNSILNQHRVLIFCQLKSMIDIIESELLKNMNNVSHLRLDGTVPSSERFNVVRKFNTDPSIDILLLTTQIGGLGLNLTGADTVIFVEHDWNPQKDLQAMDRAHRIGQTKVVNVYRLITKRTIEEKIMSLQRFKLGIANSVVNMDNSSLSSMGTEQLINMFNKEEESQKSSQNGTKTQDQACAAYTNSYQKIIDNISEIWDESQYENEFNVTNFIDSLKK